jgi:hypothetical protein
MTYKKLAFIWAIFISIVSHAQLSESANVYLLTCDIGDEVYEQFGHSAIRLVDPVNDIDLCFNWGMFEFGDDEFEFNMKFAQGRLDYYMAVEPTNVFLYIYQQTQRTVVQQELNLTLEQKNKLFELLKENAKEENRFYKYDFFYDNCATRIGDFVKLLLGENVVFSELEEETQQTFRQLIDKGFQTHPWTDFGIDLVLGYTIDQKVSNQDVMFSPIYMSRIFEDSQIKTANGMENLVLSNEVIVKGYPRKEVSDAFFTPLVATIFVILITVILAFFKLEVIFKIWTSLLFFILGILGALLLFMWFGTDHVATKGNFNLIWANPILLLLAVLIWFKKIHQKWNKIYLVLAFMMFALILFFLMLPQEFHPSSRLLIINMALQFYVLHKFSLGLKK